MDCPTCATELKRIQYENTPVLQCEQCLGYLVKQKQMVRIRIDRSTSVQQLEEQASSEQQPDTTDRIRCPRCRAVKMKKKAVQLEDQEMLLDCCPKCDHVWFDGGELSKWQADYEHSKWQRMRSKTCCARKCVPTSKSRLLRNGSTPRHACNPRHRISFFGV